MNNIKKARMAAGLSQKYVAASLGVAAPSVSNWESGKTSPTPENLSALADLFNVTIDYLLGREESSMSAVTYPGTIKPGENIDYSRSTNSNTDTYIRQQILNGTNRETPLDAPADQLGLEYRLHRLSPERRKQALDYIKFLEMQDEEGE